jgi:hypothetical protein
MDIGSANPHISVRNKQFDTFGKKVHRKIYLTFESANTDLKLMWN